MTENPAEATTETTQASDFDFVRANPSRRGFLRLTALAGLFAASPLAASAATTTKKTTKKKTTTTTTKKPAALAATTTTKAPAVASGAPFDETKELVVSFSFVASGGRVRNPYVAVWIEDAAGALVRTIDLSFENGKGVRWLPDLKRWYRSYENWLSSGATDVIDTISGPTRIPGTYSTTWDGRDENGALVKQGSYTLYIEAAREKGPYEVISETLTIGSTAMSKKLADNGELQQVSVQLKARG